MSIEDYRRLTEELPSFKEFLLAAPDLDALEVERPREPARVAPYEAWLSELPRHFADRLVPITADVCEEWGRLNVRGHLPVVDGLMAATTKVRGWTFVTRNVADLARADVRLLNPFD